MTSPLPSRPRAVTLSQRLIAIALLTTLAACGGGGDSGNAAAPSSGPFTISGKAVFEWVPTGRTGLNYAAATDKPIRGATVQLLDSANVVLATTTTDDQGDYSLPLPTSRSVMVRVRAEIKRTSSARGDRDFTVFDNTSGNAPYVLDSTAFTPTTAVTRQNLRAASGWGGTSYTGTRAAGPFSILDVIYTAQAKIETVAPTVTLPPLKIFWSVSNRAAPGSVSDGNLVTTYFTTEGGPSLYILGKADVDTDEYDTHVIAHEFGHFLQNALSRDDSIGGKHFFGDRLDMRLAFSEGWGNAWAGIALGDPVFSDTQGQNQAMVFSFDVSVAASGADLGWYSETTAQYLIWKADQTADFAATYAAFTSLKTTTAWTSLYSFAAAVKAASPANAAAITSLYASQQVVAQDAFGTGETNNGGVAGTLPVYKTHTAALGAAQNYCITASADRSPSDGNKLGEFVYVRFPIATAGSHTLTIVKTSPAGTAVTDPDFTLLKADGTRVDATSPSNSASPPSLNDTETLTVTLPTGTHTIALSDAKLASPNTSCFNFTVN